MTRKVLISAIIFISLLYSLVSAIDHFAYATDAYSDADVEKAKSDLLSNICLNHSGVNCSVINSDASVVCNDGTIDESLPTIYAVPSCQKAIEDRITRESDLMAASGCFPPSEITCTTEESYKNLSLHISSSGLGNSELGKNELSECRKEINTYLTRNNDYKKCLAENNIPPVDLPTDRMALPILKSAFCPLIYGENSSYDSDANICVCDSGYFKYNGKCTEASLICREKYGSGSTTKNGSCIRPVSTPVYIVPTPRISPSGTFKPTPVLIIADPKISKNPEPIPNLEQEIFTHDFTEKPGQNIMKDIFDSIFSGVKKLLKLL